MNNIINFETLLNSSIDQLYKYGFLGTEIVVPTKNQIDTFKIIGINHDGTNDTIDLRSSIAAIEDMYFDDKSNIYEDSNIRKYLNTDYYDEFDPIVKEYIQVMDVSSNGNILKIKLNYYL